MLLTFPLDDGSFDTTQVSRFVFEFNAADKVSHLGQTYTWYGINGVQYNASQIMRRQAEDLHRPKARQHRYQTATGPAVGHRLDC